MFRPITMLRSYVEKGQATLRFVSRQMIFVFIAFAIMALASYFFLSDIERKHLIRNVNSEIESTQANIIAELEEPKTTLGVFSETIRDMILSGSDSSRIHAYIQHINHYVQSDSQLRMPRGLGFYGFFEAFGDVLLTSRDDWEAPEDFDPKSRPWYTAAVEAKGDIGVTHPYTNIISKEVSITFSRCIFDENGDPLGIICLDMMLDKIRGYAVSTRVGEDSDSYGILGDNEFKVLAHPHPGYLGRSLTEMNDGEAIVDLLKKGEIISERRAMDYKGASSVLFVRPLQNGWFMAVIAYAKNYYRSVSKIGLILGLLGLGMALILNIILWRIAEAKAKSDIENRQKSNFLATVSHEIRTPLNAILGIAEIQMQNQALPQSTTDAINKIYNSGYSLLNIINDILDLSKIEAGKLELIPVRYDVASLIHDTVQLNMMRIGSKMIKFDLQVDPITPGELFGDELRIKQILNNLLTNAFKYTERGAVVLSVSAKYEDRVKDPYVSLIFGVTDTGQGMSAEQIHKLFDEYTRFNLEANRLTEGTGLGMSITRSLVSMMKGSISVESELGRGSTFTVHLPQKSVGAGSLGAEMVENLRHFRVTASSHLKMQPIVREPMPYGNVLIVDDVATNLYVAKGLLSPYDLTIDTAESGYETIEKITSGNVYDIIFMDHMMPKMDGIEATKIIRELGYTQPVVALTANAVAGMADIFMENGFDDFISKPIDIRQLNACLNKLIRDKQTPEVIEAARNNSFQKLEPDSASQFSIPPELAAIFVQDAKKAAVVLEEVCEKGNLVEEEDLKMYITSVHSMKSALANIGEIELSDAAYVLEMAGRERNFTLISASTRAFLDDLQVVIRKLVPGGDDGEATSEDKAFLREKLLDFREACAAYDKKTAKDILVEIKKLRWPYQTKEVLNVLVEHLLQNDFEEASNIAKDLASAAS